VRGQGNNFYVDQSGAMTCIALDAKRMRRGIAWVATATHAATDCALRAVRQQYGNEAGPESKKVSRR
jgi:hypothetical protein